MADIDLLETMVGALRRAAAAVEAIMIGEDSEWIYEATRDSLIFLPANSLVQKAKDPSKCREHITGFLRRN